MPTNSTALGKKSLGVTSGKVSQPQVATRPPSVGDTRAVAAPKPPAPATNGGTSLASGNISQPKPLPVPTSPLPIAGVPVAPTPGNIVMAPPAPTPAVSPYTSQLAAGISPLPTPPVFDMSDYNTISADPVLRQWLHYLTM